MAGGQSAQKNKAHKPGRRAGQSARARSRNGKHDVKAASNQASQLARKGKESRMQQVTNARNKSRQEALQRMRHEHAPVVVQVLSTSTAVDEQRIWCAFSLRRDVLQSPQPALPRSRPREHNASYVLMQGRAAQRM